MATAERPPAKIDGKPNPAYQKWYRQQKKAEKAPPKSVMANFTRQPGAPNHEVLNPNADGSFTLPSTHFVPDDMPKAGAPLMLRALKPAPNKKFIWCDRDGNRVAVRVMQRNIKMLLGKDIPVREEADGTFTHAP